MRGVCLRSDRSFERLFQPLLPQFQRFAWLLDFQTGPFDSAWLGADEANASRLDRLRVDVPACRNTSASAWRPGLLPTLAARLRFDEWSTMTGFEAAPVEIEPIATEFVDVRPLGRAYFTLVEQHAAISITYVDDRWWEIYPARRDWLETLLDLPGAERVDSGKWRRT
jgi:hypothetical protein